MEWSFDCDATTQLKPTPAKRPRLQPKKTSVDTFVPLKSIPRIVDKKTLKSLPELLKACEPQQPSELSISRQKQKEICDWLEFSTPKGRPSALILSGPSGCGKTVGFKLLANERGFDCIEWITPTDQGFDENSTSTQSLTKQLETTI